MNKRASRRKIRRVLLQLLYNEELAKSGTEAMPGFFYELDLEDDQKEFIKEIFWEIQKKQAYLDELIQSYATKSGWDKNRLSVIDRNILRLAFLELDRGEVDAAVAINEAVELAKTFSTEQSPKFINGILGAYVRNRQKGTVIGK